MTELYLPLSGDRITVPDGEGIYGVGFWELFDADGNLADTGEFHNIVTNYGDRYYGERAAGIATPPAQVTGMQLGTGGGTAASKNSTGAGIVTLTANSLVAIDATWPTSNGIQSGAVALTIQWKTTWPAGTATANGINEVALVNQTTATQTVVPPGTTGTVGTISRAVLGTTVNKGASDSLAITWNHNILGA